MLKYDPIERITAEQALHDEFFASFYFDLSSEEKHKLRSNYLFIFINNKVTINEDNF